MLLSETRHILKNRHLANSYTKIIFSYVLEINNLDSDKRKPLIGGLDMALRILTGSHVSFVSKQLLSDIITEKLKLNPFLLKWEQRHLMGRQDTHNQIKSFAVWEHTIPIKEFRNDLIQSISLEDIKLKIESYPGTAWITKEENKSLNKNGFMSKRPGGFIECYEKVGIELLNEVMYRDQINT